MNRSAAFWADPWLWTCEKCGACDDAVRSNGHACARHSLPPEGASDEEWAEWLMNAEVSQ